MKRLSAFPVRPRLKRAVTGEPGPGVLFTPVLRLCLLTLVVAQAAQAQAAPARGLTLLDAVRSTLANHPLLHIQEEQVRLDRGVKQQASGQFDATILARGSQANTNEPLTILQEEQAAAQGATLDDVVTFLTSYNAEYQQEFRNGVSITPFITATRTADNLQNQTGTDITQVAFQLNIPLMRGRGTEVVAAQETAAGIQVDASIMDLNQEIANLVTQTAESYWKLKAAIQAYDVLVDSEQRGLKFVQDVRTLIAADRIARGEMNQVQANLADRTANRIAAQQTVFQARQQLALAMGVGADEIAEVGLTPSDPFPNGENQPMPSDNSSAVGFYISQALANRADVLAARKRENASGVLEKAAANQLRPQLDLSFSAGYTGLREGLNPYQYLFSLNGGHRPDVTIGLNYSFPPARNAARGQLLQADASRRQAALQINETSRQAASAVLVATEALRNAIAGLKKARESVEYYRAALEGEREKLRLANGSLLNTVTMEDYFNSAENTWISAQQAYASALVDFRYGTGTLIAPDKPAQSIDESVFLTFPFPQRLEAQ